MPQGSEEKLSGCGPERPSVGERLAVMSQERSTLADSMISAVHQRADEILAIHDAEAPKARYAELMLINHQTAISTGLSEQQAANLALKFDGSVREMVRLLEPRTSTGRNPPND